MRTLRHTILITAAVCLTAGQAAAIDWTLLDRGLERSLGSFPGPDNNPLIGEPGPQPGVNPGTVQVGPGNGAPSPVGMTDLPSSIERRLDALRRWLQLEN